MKTEFYFRLNNRPTAETKNAVNEDKEYKIFFIVKLPNNDRKPIVTEYAVKKKQFYEHKDKFHFQFGRSGEVSCVHNHPLKDKINRDLTTLVEKAKAKYKELQNNSIVDAKEIKDHLENKIDNTHSFFYFGEILKKQRLANEQDTAVKHIDFMLNAVKEYQKEKQLYVEQVDKKFLDEFYEYLNTRRVKNCKTGKRISHSSIRLIHTYLIRTIKKADEYGLKINTQVFQYDLPKETQKPYKEKLTEQQIMQLRDVDLGNAPKTALARDVFIFCYYCFGMRVGDAIRLRWYNIKDGRLRFDAEKTNSSTDVKIQEEALEIAKRYNNNPQEEDFVFPFLQNEKSWYKAITQKEKDELPTEDKKRIKSIVEAVERRLCTQIKIAAEKANLTNIHITNHTARHSFANNAKNNGVDIYAIKTMLRHKNISTTQTYLDSLPATSFQKDIEKAYGKNVMDYNEEELSNLPKNELIKIIIRSM